MNGRAELSACGTAPYGPPPGLLMPPHHVEKTVHDGILGASRLEPRRGDFVADLLERGIIGNIPARSVGVRHHNGVAPHGFLFEMFLNHGHHFARYSRQGDVVDREQAESNTDWV